MSRNKLQTAPPLASTANVVSMLIIDAILIVIFAMIGVSSHDGDLDPLNIARVAIPFLLPYILLAAIVMPTRLIHNVFPAGLALWLATIIIGPILRAAFFNDSSAFAFVLVTAGVLAVFLLGRRGISASVTRRHKTS